MDGARRKLLSAVLGGTGVIALSPAAAAASAHQLDQDSARALQTLYAAQPKARTLGDRATGILVFPKIIKAGLLVGGQSGDGALRVGGKTTSYYNISAASFGLQLGAQSFSYAMFFMNEAALKYLSDSDGWAIGSGPSVVVMDKGKAASMTSTTLTKDVYAFPFGQHGLMAGLGLEGSKITRITPSS
jgi:lipid-binding SYLF domain-containing protein